MTMSARVLGAGGALLGLLVYAGWPAPADGTQRPDYDVVITNGLVLDGSGQAAVRADVAIRDGVIAAVGSLGASASAHRRPKRSTRRAATSRQDSSTSTRTPPKASAATDWNRDVR